MQLNRTRFITFVISLCALIFLSGCFGSGVKLNLKSEKSLNPDLSNQSLPVVVRVYQLSDDKAFINSKFNDLWKNDEKTLGRDLLAKDEFMMPPSHEKKVTYDREEKTEFVGVIGIFRKPEKASKNWKTW